MKSWNVLRLVLLLVVVTAAGSAVLLLPIREYAVQVLGWVRGLGMWGPIALGAIYIPATILFLPGSLLTLATGFLFGVFRGTLTASLASTLGAAVAFFVGRFIARDWIQAKVSKSPKFKALDDAVAEQGFKVVLLTRLSPMFPFNFLNYALAMTRVSFREYLLASWLGMLPGTVLFVYIGSSLASLSEISSGEFEGGLASKILLGMGLIATIVVTTVAARMAQRALA